MSISKMTRKKSPYFLKDSSSFTKHLSIDSLTDLCKVNSNETECSFYSGSTKNLVVFDSFQIEKSWWDAILKEESKKDYFLKITHFISHSSTPIFPPLHQIFNWTLFCPFSKVKVVIIGQDPYYNEGQAHGLAFSVPLNYRPVPKSTEIIYTELHRTFPSFSHPNHGCLENWAKQGVLLLNSCLTVQEGKPMSHFKLGWGQLTDTVIEKICQRNQPVVFLLWGRKAQQKEKLIMKYLPVGSLTSDSSSNSDNSNIKILKASHPSPSCPTKDFVGCDHFLLANEFLQSHSLQPINWNVTE